MDATMDEIRAWLDPDEIDYPAAAAALGQRAVPRLQELAGGTDNLLATKAIYLASLIGGDNAHRLVADAARQTDPVRRVAAASGLRNLTEDAALPLVGEFLADADPGVRKVALASAASFDSAEMRAQIRRAAEQDPESA